ncbi:hypothetical protein LS482_16015 [Sinomicrobium kalidii]|uniref:hypothetical protein n=1 Tax=Sinomicrobium kalidii TaxID=2900738 RepID=UPI001E3CE515|nr:hypothetical protein [Sinomicrobium kalidii]UGU15178.1 hypothetical protein LS482_16015 [Sinomicrobium kalidii]
MEEKFTYIKERVLYLAKYKRIKIESFLQDIGMTYGSFKGKAKKGTLNSDAIAKILTTHRDVSPQWLLMGEGEMLKNQSPNLEVENWITYESNHISDKHSEEGLLRVGLRLDEVLEYKELSNEKFASILGVSYVNLLEMIAAKIPVPEHVLNTIHEEFPEIKEAWLFTGKGKMIDKSVASKLQSNEKELLHVKEMNDQLKKVNSLLEEKVKNLEKEIPKKLPKNKNSNNKAS